MDLKTQLLARATTYCKTRDITLASLATLVMNDGKFFERLQKGNADCRTRTYEKFVTFFGDHPPAQARRAARGKGKRPGRRREASA